MTISIDRLSLWEIAHRWHNADPSYSISIADIPLEVKDTLRNLASEVYYERLYSTLLLERESKNEEPEFTRQWPYFWKKTWFKNSVGHYSKEFKETMNNRIDPVFLQSVMVPFWELEFWCKEFKVPFPSFWLRSITHRGSIASFPGAIAFKQEESDEPEPENDISSEHKTESNKNTKSEKNRKAALAKHEATYKLKRRCIDFFIAHYSDGKFSNDEVARRFYCTLSDDEQKILIPSNGPKTLSTAISEYKRGLEREWLSGIPPYTEEQR